MDVRADLREGSYKLPPHQGYNGEDNQEGPPLPHAEMSEQSKSVGAMNGGRRSGLQTVISFFKKPKWAVAVALLIVITAMPV